MYIIHKQERYTTHINMTISRANQPSLPEIDKSGRDAHLLERISKQDISAYEALYDKYAAQVYGVILRIVRNPEIASDLLQETFWQIWQSAPSYREQGTPAAWIFRIARNRSMDELRRQRARPQSDESIEPVEALIGLKFSNTSFSARVRLIRLGSAGCSGGIISPISYAFGTGSSLIRGRFLH